MYTVAEIMTTDLHTVGADTTLSDARDKMTELGIRHLPVVDDKGELVGLISQRDVLAAMDSDLYRIDESQTTEREDWVCVADFMTTRITTVDEHASARSAARHLERRKYDCLPVVTDGKLVGIVTDTDFVGLAINLLEQIEAAEPEPLDP